MGTLPIVGVDVSCAVLSNGLRVLSQRGLYGALGGSRSKGRRQGEDRVDDLPPFLAAKNLEPFISEELRSSTSKPIIYRYELADDGGRKTTVTAHGTDARMIPEICDVFLRARESGALSSKIGWMIRTQAGLVLNDEGRAALQTP